MITETQQGIQKLELFEMLDLIDKADDPVPLVKDFASKFSSFTDYLRCVFDESIQFNLPEGKPPYHPAKRPASSWHKRHMDLGYWVKGLKGDQMNPIRREKIFLDTLEAVHAEDALLLVEMVSKKTPSKKLTEEVVREALPKLLS